MTNIFSIDTTWWGAVFIPLTYHGSRFRLSIVWSERYAAWTLSHSLWQAAIPAIVYSIGLGGTAVGAMFLWGGDDFVYSMAKIAFVIACIAIVRIGARESVTFFPDGRIERRLCIYGVPFVRTRACITDLILELCPVNYFKSRDNDLWGCQLIGMGGRLPLASGSERFVREYIDSLPQFLRQRYVPSPYTTTGFPVPLI